MTRGRKQFQPFASRSRGTVVGILITFALISGLSIVLSIRATDRSQNQAKVVQVNASTGAIQNTFITVPNGCTGASVWSSPAIDEANGILYFTTGEQGTCSTNEPFAIALVILGAREIWLNMNGARRKVEPQLITSAIAPIRSEIEAEKTDAD